MVVQIKTATVFKSIAASIYPNSDRCISFLPSCLFVNTDKVKGREVTLIDKMHKTSI